MQQEPILLTGFSQRWVMIPGQLPGVIPHSGILLKEGMPPIHGPYLAVLNFVLEKPSILLLAWHPVLPVMNGERMESSSREPIPIPSRLPNWVFIPPEWNEMVSGRNGLRYPW